MKVPAPYDRTLLLDFYGELLPEPALTYLRLHLEEDLSLREIAETYSLSRQAVHYHIQKGLDQLFAYEARLHQVARWQAFHEQIAIALAALKAGAISEATARLEDLQVALDRD